MVKKKYLWTEIDWDDKSTWPEPDYPVLVTCRMKSKPGYWRHAIASAWIYEGIKSLWKWEKKETLYFRGCQHFRPEFWRPLLDLDYPDSEHYKEIEEDE